MLRIDSLAIRHQKVAPALSSLLKRGKLAGSRSFEVRTPTIDISDGEIVAIAGPNGSGKSTLFNGIVGFLEPVSGAVRLADREGSPWREVKGYLGRALRLGVVAQSTSLDLKLTVAQNLDLAGRLYGLSASERASRKVTLLERAGLAGFEDRVVGRLSGGQTRRVDIVRALMSDPELLLLDEAASSLDRQSTEAMWRHLRRHLLSRETGLRSILFISHSEKELEVADAFILMKEGLASPLVRRDELEKLVRHDHIVLGLKPGCDGDGIRRLRERLEGLCNGGTSRVSDSLLSVDLTSPSPLLSLHIPDGRSVVPQIFSWDEASIIETVELRPEGLMDRLERWSCPTAASTRRSGGFEQAKGVFLQ